MLPLSFHVVDILLALGRGVLVAVRISGKLGFAVLLMLVVACSFLGSLSSAQEPTGEAVPGGPKYVLELSLPEFSVLNSAALLAINQYGGQLDFKVKMSRENNVVVWTITIDKPRLIEAWSHWLAEKSLGLIGSMNPDSIDVEVRTALRTVKSLAAKLDSAKNNPVWDTVRVSGKLVENEGNLFIESGQGKYLLTGGKVKNIKVLSDSQVIGAGFAKVKNELQLLSLIPKKTNTLELFVMSLCPFGRAAASQVIRLLRSDSITYKPELEIHYIFYRDETSEGEVFFTALHGEPEIAENLVQIVIRDSFSEFFHDYLLERYSPNGDTLSWDTVASRIGMEDRDIVIIKDKIDEERALLIQKEYGYVTTMYGIYDGSPRYVWEGDRIADLTQVERFKNETSSLEQCSK